MAKKLQQIFPIEPTLTIKLNYKKDGKKIQEEKKFKLERMTMDDFTYLIQEVGSEQKYAEAFLGRTAEQLTNLMKILYQLMSDEDKEFIFKLNVTHFDKEAGTIFEVKDQIKKLMTVIDLESLYEMSRNLEQAYKNSMPDKVKKKGDAPGEIQTGQA